MSVRRLAVRAALDKNGYKVVVKLLRNFSL
jgi:hypothetical protein